MCKTLFSRFRCPLISRLLAVSLLLSAAAMSQGGQSARPVMDMVRQFQADMAALALLEQRKSRAPAADAEALAFRADERSLQLLQDIHRLQEATAELPADDPDREAVIALLEEQLGAAGESALARITRLDGHIAGLQAELESQSGAALLATEAYVESLEALRFDYYDAVVALIEGRELLGLPEVGATAELLPRLYLQGEAMAGGIEYRGGALGGLRARQANDADNTELAAALSDMSRQQSLDIGRLELLVGLLKRLGEDPVAYRALLLEQGQGLSVAALDRNAVLTLLDDGWQSLRESVVRGAPDLVFKLVVFLVIILAFRSLAGLTRRTVKAACERPGVDLSTLLKDVLVSVSGGVVMALGILIALSQVGISLGPMLAGLGVAGFVVGFALQDTLGNFAAGGMILIYRPYDVDDFVEVAGASGLVKKMSLVSTTITTFDNQTLVVPNSKIWGDVIKNVTAQKVRRVDMVFGIGYDDDIECAERVLRSVLEDHERVLAKPEYLVKLHELADSSVNFVVRPWVRTEDYWSVYWDVTREVKQRFDREGISIPYPQRDVHLYREAAESPGGEA